MVDIYEVAESTVAAVRAREAAAQAEIVSAYRDVWTAVRRQSDLLFEAIVEREAAGVPVSLDWLFELERLGALQAQIERELDRFAARAYIAISSAQSDMADMAAENARALMLAQRVDPGVVAAIGKLPTSAVERLVGFLGDGSPLREALDRYGPLASQQARQVFVIGLATGQPVELIAKHLRRTLGLPLRDALTLARTEVMRSYREASRELFMASRAVVTGWRWHSALGKRTCAFCWAMHGSLHPPGEIMATHPNCRCAMVPVTVPWSQLGVTGVSETSATGATGPDIFRRQSPQTKLSVLGPMKYAAYRAGVLRLEDIPGFRYDPRWGPVGFERSMRDIMAAKR